MADSESVCFLCALTLGAVVTEALLGAGTCRPRTRRSSRGSGGRSLPLPRPPLRPRTAPGACARWSSSDPCSRPRSPERSSGPRSPSASSWGTRTHGPPAGPRPARTTRLPPRTSPPCYPQTTASNLTYWPEQTHCPLLPSSYSRGHYKDIVYFY